MKTVTLPNGEKVPALGQGTWFIGDSAATRAQEIEALRCGLDRGLSLIDTAEMYGDGRSEKLVGEAIAGRRDEVFLVSKVYPHNASRRGAIAACERSLKRLGTDRLDLYLLHWRGGVPFEETVAAFEQLQADGKIRHWGVSNLDPEDMEELWDTPGGDKVAANQVLYNLTRRGIEHDLLPWQRSHQVPLMAYSPVEQSRLLEQRGLQELARHTGLTCAQLALAWVLRHDNVIAIPKAGQRGHVLENAAAADLTLAPEVLAALDRLYAAPRGRVPLEML